MRARKRTTKQHWRKRAKSFSDMPTWLLCIVGSAAGLCAGYYSIVLAETGIPYLHAANAVPLIQWPWQAWYLTVMLPLLLIIAYCHSEIALRCNAILRERWFK